MLGVVVVYVMFGMLVWVLGMYVVMGFVLWWSEVLVMFGLIGVGIVCGCYVLK